jgi:hypothetical protein
MEKDVKWTSCEMEAREGEPSYKEEGQENYIMKKGEGEQ